MLGSLSFKLLIFNFLMSLTLSNFEIPAHPGSPNSKSVGLCYSKTLGVMPLWHRDIQKSLYYTLPVLLAQLLRGRHLSWRRGRRPSWMLLGPSAWRSGVWGLRSRAECRTWAGGRVAWSFPVSPDPKDKAAGSEREGTGGAGVLLLLPFAFERGRGLRIGR